MSDQQGFPEPLGDGGGTGGDDGSGGPDGSEDPDTARKGIRGRTIAIIVLAVVVVALLVLIAVMAFANGSKGSPTSSPTVTPTASPTQTSTATPTSTATSGATPTCSVDDLSVTLGTPSGAAGSEYLPIDFTNTSSKACELHGFPGVSFVGNGNGTQLGAPADWDTSQTIVQNTLQPGTVVVSNLKIAQAGNYDPSECQPLAADGLRIYPPHSTKAVFVKASNLTACQNANVHLLTVISPVAPPQ
ncbi:DUF4232 domain-containing protein [Planctomonas sp. JC2975]|uniref:DUF4232 domain-containing protein n=1 Tax=Planctomonas sp. JC2975 TaxID=2729626 RepID=UPI001473CCB5|nr:DUF4232 domain-containing protein [Planctomonas sp. JC2975]NNC12667.1 DUF4232 domain-containing protein [Planctomonas sp. JC2975]